MTTWITGLDADTLQTAVRPKRKLAGLVAALSLLESLVMTFGVGLVYPIVALVIGGTESLGLESDNIFSRYFPTDIGISSAFTLLVLIFVVKSSLSLWRVWTMRLLAESLRVHWSSTIADNLYRKTLRAHHQVRDGAKVGTIAREPKLAARCIAGSVSYFVNLLAIILMFSLAIYASWQATLAFTIIGGGLGILLRLTLLRRIQTLGDLRLKANHRLIAEIVETISAIKDVKALGLEKKMREKMDIESHELAKISVLSNFFTQIPTILTDLVAISIFLAFVYVMLTIHDGNITSLLPEIALFFTVLVKLFSSGNQVITARATILANLASLNHIIEILKNPTGGKDLEPFGKGVAIQSFDSDLALKQVTFGFDPELPILQDVDLTFKRGSVTYVVGPSGIGKTTLVDLLLRYYEPQSGEVRINNRNINDFDLQAWRRRIGYVSQDALLFSGSVRDNILIGNPSASDEKIDWAAGASGALDFIQKLPKGYDTLVGEKGVTLSGGQRMRVAIARAAVRDPDLVIIDEGTARFELSLEAQMVKILRALPTAPTVIIITHRRESTKLGDHVIDFETINSSPVKRSDGAPEDATVLKLGQS